MPDETPKIIIDEGWKAQVQREREEAARRREQEAREKAEREKAAESAPAAEASDVSVPAETVAPHPQQEALPAEEEALEASFMNLVASLATQAMFALGVMAPPGARQVMVNLDQAQFMIDTLAMLREKTQGNLNADETAGIDEALDELQRIYLARVQQWQEETLRQSGINPDDLRGGTTPFQH